MTMLIAVWRALLGAGAAVVALADALLKEDGDTILLETNDRLLLE